MKDYIEREVAIKASKMVYCELLSGGDDELLHTDADDVPVVFVRDIEAIPAADVKPVVRGEWISDDKTGSPICSVCHSRKPTRCFEIRFCYFCGAEMEPFKEESVNNEI